MTFFLNFCINKLFIILLGYIFIEAFAYANYNNVLLLICTSLTFFYIYIHIYIKLYWICMRKRSCPISINVII